MTQAGFDTLQILKLWQMAALHRRVGSLDFAQFRCPLCNGPPRGHLLWSDHDHKTIALVNVCSECDNTYEVP